MKILVYIFLLANYLFASNLMTYNIYERDDRVDIMLSFDTPYDGSIKQQQNKNAITLILSDLSTDQNIDKSLNSTIIQNIFIGQNDQTSTKLDLYSNKKIKITASKTSDKFGLRIRISPFVDEVGAATNMQTKDTTSDSRYIAVIIALFILLAILLFVKKFIAKKIGKNFIKSITTSSYALSNSIDKRLNSTTVEIIYEKNLDAQNKVVLLSYENKKYIVLTGSSNVMLDKFGDEAINTKNDFEAFFEENRQKLGNYLNSRKNSLDTYKDMVSKD